MLDLETGEDGFFLTHIGDRSKTDKDFIFIAGTCQGPEDIAESITHGIHAASAVIEHMIKRGFSVKI